MHVVFCISLACFVGAIVARAVFGREVAVGSDVDWIVKIDFSVGVGIGYVLNISLLSEFSEPLINLAKFIRLQFVSCFGHRCLVEKTESNFTVTNIEITTFIFDGKYRNHL